MDEKENQEETSTEDMQAMGLRKKDKAQKRLLRTAPRVSTHGRSDMNNTAQIVSPYFDVQWAKNRTAAEAFELGRDAAARVFEKRAKDIRALGFNAFKADCCHKSVKAESRRS